MVPTHPAHGGTLHHEPHCTCTGRPCPQPSQSMPASPAPAPSRQNFEGPAATSSLHAPGRGSMRCLLHRKAHRKAYKEVHTKARREAHRKVRGRYLEGLSRMFCPTERLGLQLLLGASEAVAAGSSCLAHFHACSRYRGRLPLLNSAIKPTSTTRPDGKRRPCLS